MGTGRDGILTLVAMVLGKLYTMQKSDTQTLDGKEASGGLA